MCQNLSSYKLKEPIFFFTLQKQEFVKKKFKEWQAFQLINLLGMKNIEMMKIIIIEMTINTWMVTKNKKE